MPNKIYTNKVKVELNQVWQEVELLRSSIFNAMNTIENYDGLMAANHVNDLNKHLSKLNDLVANFNRYIQQEKDKE
jgi:hypothetical protein